MSVFERLKDLIVEQMGVDEEQIVEEAKFEEDLGADSITVVELVMALEEEFDIEIPDEDSQKMKTVGDVVKYVESRI